MTDEKNEVFWIVWCPGRRLPKIRHDSEEKAVFEARRVADKEKRKVFVCRGIGVATWTRHAQKAQA